MKSWIDRIMTKYLPYLNSFAYVNFILWTQKYWPKSPNPSGQCIFFYVSKYSTLHRVFSIALFSAPELRGVWVATVLNIDYPRSRFQSPAQSQQELRELVAEVTSLNFNAIFFQVWSSYCFNKDFYIIYQYLQATIWMKWMLCE